MLSLKEKKRLYDIEYRRINKKLIAEKKRTFNSSPAGRAMQKRHRIKFKKYHLKYCQTPEYKTYKSKYDQIHRAKLKYGEFWECMILVEAITEEILRVCPDKYERDKMRGNINRIQAKQALKRHLKYGWRYNWNHILNLYSIKGA